MANIYGVCPERALQHKGYGDFVQHTNPLKEGMLRLALNEPQTLQVTIGYLQNQAAYLQLAYNPLKRLQTPNMASGQTLRNSFGCVQIKLGKTLSLKLKADNSLIGLISVRESELVNPLIQLNSVDSTESANSLIIAKTCIAGTSPNVLMKFDSDNFPSRDDTQKAQKEKGSVRSAAFWDDCSFNHEENHYSTDLDNNADLRHEKNQRLSQPFLGRKPILISIGGWDLRLYGTLSTAQTLHTEIIGTQNLQVVKSYSQNNPEIIGEPDSVILSNPTQPFGLIGLCLLPNRCFMSRSKSEGIKSSGLLAGAVSFASCSEVSSDCFDFCTITTHTSFVLVLRCRRSSLSFAISTISRMSEPARAPISPILDRACNASSKLESSFSSPLSFSCRRAISLRIAVTINPALLSSGLFNASMPSITSWGMRIEICFDLSLTVFLAMSVYLMIWCDSVYTIIKSQKGLTCDSLEFNLNHASLLWCDSQRQRPGVLGTTTEASNHNVTRTYIMACLHDTKTRPNFTYLFLGTPSDLPTCTPTVLRAEADTEAEARAKFIDWDLTFAAQIRTAAPSRLQLFSTDDGFMWIYEQRQEASHA
ncbi:host cell division inhibitor Icd-like protein [Hafnia paralvei]|uniref:host cell division inhibitor Icd-like protein n=2 Tax=Hafniaceae TaxID=1903412 RepID=UPI003C52CBED